MTTQDEFVPTQAMIDAGANALYPNYIARSDEFEAMSEEEYDALHVIRAVAPLILQSAAQKAAKTREEMTEVILMVASVVSMLGASPPPIDRAELNEATDDAACSVIEQAASAIRVMKGQA